MLCACAAVTVIGLAAPAAADVAVSTPGFVQAGPRLVGGGFVYADERRRRTRIRLVTASGRQRVMKGFPQLVAETEPEDEFGASAFTTIEVELDASRAGVALQVQRSFCFNSTSGDSDCSSSDIEYWVARFNGTAVRVLRCPGHAKGANDVAMSGPQVAMLGCRRRGGRRILLFNAATGRLREIEAPRGYGGFAAVEAAGRYVAAETAGDRAPHVILLNGHSDAEVLRAPAPTRPAGFMVQEDGKLLVESAEGAAECANWYLPAEPRAHPVARRPCLGALARDRIVTTTPVDELNDQLALTDLRGSPLRPLAPPMDNSVHHPFDFDGTRVADAVLACRGYHLIVERLRDILKRGPRPERPCQRTAPD